MTDKPKNSQAFPSEGGMYSGLYADPGMFLRDYFVSHSGITMGDAINSLGLSSLDNFSREDVMNELVKLRLYYADAMLKARQ